MATRLAQVDGKQLAPTEAGAERHGQDRAGTTLELSRAWDGRPSQGWPTSRSRSAGLRNLLLRAPSRENLRKFLPPMGLRCEPATPEDFAYRAQLVMRTQFPASPDDIDLSALGAAVRRVLPKLLIAAAGGRRRQLCGPVAAHARSMPRRPRSRSSPRGSATRSSRAATPARRSSCRCAWTRRRSPPTCGRCSRATWRSSSPPTCKLADEARVQQPR